MAKQLQYTLVGNDTDTNLTVVYKGKTFMAHNSHAAWDQLIAKTLADDPAVVDLFNVGLTIGQRLALSQRVTYADGKLYLDHDEMAEGLTTHVIRMLQAGDDVVPFVALLEHIAENPSENSRKQLYNYIDRNHITITQGGLLVLYKVVRRPAGFPEQWRNKTYQSCHAGPGIVNGLDWSGNGGIPQSIGDTIEMPRSKVVDNPAVACHTGLHVGAWSYVSGGPMRGDVILEVHVHPRDVVSVPRDYNETKIRVCRYVVVGERTKPYDVPVLPDNLVKPVATPAVAVAVKPPKTTQEHLSNLRSRQGSNKHPGNASFANMRINARRQKKGLNRYMVSKGWVQVPGSDGSKREDWIPA